MSRSYSYDLRMKVMSYLGLGHTKKEASKVFGISLKTIYNWLSLKEETGSVKAKAVKSYEPSKIKEKELKEYVAAHPDAYLEEIASVFKGSISGICRALKRLKITRKKSRYFIQRETKANEKSFSTP
jgi:transposase